MTVAVPHYSRPAIFSEDSTAPSLTVGTLCAAVQLRALGKVELLRQAGIAVSERGSSGRLAAARVYDDVQAPVEGR
jgi:hypothetical protein